MELIFLLETPCVTAMHPASMASHNNAKKATIYLFWLKTARMRKKNKRAVAGTATRYRAAIVRSKRAQSAIGAAEDDDGQNEQTSKASGTRSQKSRSREHIPGFRT